jgi:hypothetical protein
LLRLRLLNHKPLNIVITLERYGVGCFGTGLALLTARANSCEKLTGVPFKMVKVF